MTETEHTAIVLHYTNYKDSDRMITLFSPQKGRLEANCRGCRKPKSPLLNAAELFALGDFMLYEKSGRYTVTSVSLIETFYPLRMDFDRLTCATYLLSLCDAVVQPGEPARDLFMLLLHTLSRLTYSDQEWRPLLSGFLLHFAALNGFRPRLLHCIRCGDRLTGDTNAFFDLRGGMCCPACRMNGDQAVSAAQQKFMRMAYETGASKWVNTPDCHAPFGLLRRYVETQMGQRIHGSRMLPDD